MTKIKITTTQHIDIEYELATVFDRILAWLIDFVIIVGYVLLAIAVLNMIVFLPDRGLVALVMLPGLFYHLVSSARVLVHGDDFVAMGDRRCVKKFQTQLANYFTIKSETIGSDPSQGEPP